MKQRIITALLCACLALSLAAPALAAPAAVSREEAAQAICALGIMDGGDLEPGRKITRAEFTAMAVRALAGGGAVGQAATSPYPDVPRSHWAAGYVEAGVARGLVTGYTDGTFRPDDQVTLAQGADMALKLLGYGPGDFTGAYPSGQMAMFCNLKLDRGVSALGASDPLSRGDAVYLFYNLLSAPVKGGGPYIQTLGHSLDANGRVDLLSLVNGEMEGPVVALGNWRDSLPFTPGKVYRGGGETTLDAVRDYDVLYWNRSMGALWAYSQKVTGTIQDIQPSAAAPASVKVAGRTYAIESSAAAYALSDLGKYRLGDPVTLLLGRGGGVAAVADAATSAGERVGVVTDVSDGTYPDGKGGSYTAQTVTILATDGQSYQYQSRTNLKAGALVRAVVDEKGTVSLKGLSSKSLSGRVSRDGGALGGHPFAPDAEILDVGGGRGAVVYPSRLAGLSLSASQVKYYSLNAMGEIERLILSDVTGDMYAYGVLTGLEEMGQDMFATYAYQYDVGGRTYALPASTTRYPVSEGPIQVVGDPAAPERLRSLTAARGGALEGGQYVAGGRRYTLSGNVAVYEYRGGSYYLSSLARAESGDFALTGWYDKAESAGGRIRVIVAREK